MTTLAIPFDTLAFVKELETAGVPAPQAEAQARALSNVLQKVDETRSRELVTKGDLAVLKSDIAELKRDVRELKTRIDEWFKEMDSRFKELELRMVIKLGGMIILAVGVIMTSLRIWPIPVQQMPPSAQVQEMRTPMASPAPIHR